MVWGHCGMARLLLSEVELLHNMQEGAYALIQQIEEGLEVPSDLFTDSHSSRVVCENCIMEESVCRLCATLDMILHMTRIQMPVKIKNKVRKKLGAEYAVKLSPEHTDNIIDVMFSSAVQHVVCLLLSDMYNIHRTFQSKEIYRAPSELLFALAYYTHFSMMEDAAIVSLVRKFLTVGIAVHSDRIHTSLKYTSRRILQKTYQGKQLQLRQLSNTTSVVSPDTSVSLSPLHISADSEPRCVRCGVGVPPPETDVCRACVQAQLDREVERERMCAVKNGWQEEVNKLHCEIVLLERIHRVCMLLVDGPRHRALPLQQERAYAALLESKKHELWNKRQMIDEKERELAARF